MLRGLERKHRLVLAAVVLMVALCLACAAWWLAMPRETMPNLVGLDGGEAVALLEEQGYHAVVLQPETTPSFVGLTREEAQDLARENGLTLVQP